MKLGPTMKPPATVALEELPPDQEVKLENRSKRGRSVGGEIVLSGFRRHPAGDQGRSLPPPGPQASLSLFLGRRNGVAVLAKALNRLLSRTEQQRRFNETHRERSLSLIDQTFELAGGEGDRNMHQDSFRI